MFYKKLYLFIKEEIEKNGLNVMFTRFFETLKKDPNAMTPDNYKEYEYYITKEERLKLIKLNNNIIKYILRNRDDIYDMLVLLDKNEKAFITALSNEMDEVENFMYCVQKHITALALDARDTIFNKDENVISPYTVDFYSGMLMFSSLLEQYRDETNFKISFKEYIDKNTADNIDFVKLNDKLYKRTQLIMKEFNDTNKITPLGAEYNTNYLLYLFKVWCNFSIKKDKYYAGLVQNREISYEFLKNISTYESLPDNLITSVPVPLHNFYYEDIENGKITRNWNYIVDKYLVFSRDPSLYIDGLDEHYSENTKDSESIRNINLNYMIQPYRFSNSFLKLDNITQNDGNITLYYVVIYNNGIPADLYTDILTGKPDMKKGIMMADKLAPSTNIVISLNTVNNTLSYNASNRIYFAGMDKFVNLSKIITPLDLWYGFQVGFNEYKINKSNNKLLKILDSIDNTEDIYIVEKLVDNKLTVKKMVTPEMNQM